VEAGFQMSAMGVLMLNGVKGLLGLTWGVQKQQIR
jgi:hypothetical protein